MSWSLLKYTSHVHMWGIPCGFQHHRQESPFLGYANTPWLPWQCHWLCYLPIVFQGQVAEVGAPRAQDSGLDQQETGKAVRCPTRTGASESQQRYLKKWGPGGQRQCTTQSRDLKSEGKVLRTNIIAASVPGLTDHCRSDPVHHLQCQRQRERSGVGLIFVCLHARHSLCGPWAL